MTQPDLALIVITDAALAAPRAVRDVVRLALSAGAPAIQLRDKHATARELHEQARELLPLVLDADALLFINDRIDVALAVGAHGVHLGPDDMPIAAARRIVPPQFLIGYSTDQPALARDAERDGASYIGCGAVYGTATKPEAAGEAIGLERLDDVAASVSIPVIAIGGITPERAGEVATTRAAGVAVVGAVMAAPDPRAATINLLRNTRRTPG